ncbi:MAG: TonB-dependent receptor, partial [Acetobacteraceae bacterium]
MTTRETFMAEQVEVLEGPAGVISGRGTTGGAINVVTKQPLADNFYNISVTGGTDATARVTADINQNLSDKFAFRVNGLFQNAQVSERDYVYDDRYGISLAGLWKPTDDVRVYADYYFVYFDQLPDWGVPFDPRVRRPFTETGVDRSNYYGVVSRDFQHNYQHMGTAGVEWNVKPWLTLNNKFRYSYTVTDYVAAKPGTPNLTNPDWTQWTVASTPASRYQVNQTIADQLDATFTFYAMGWKHSLVTGIEFAREEISQDSYSNLAIECFPNCTSAAATGINYSLFWPASNSIVTATSPTRNGRPTVTAVNTFSAYVLDTMNLNDRLFINIGGRFDNYDITKTPFGAASVTRTDPLFNWNAGLLYKIIPNLGAYIAYSTSSNPVGSELDASSDAYGGLAANNQVFAPERNTALEVGLKWELFEKRMLLTTALFQTTKDNARETIGTGATATLDDTAAYRIRGLQLGVAGNITDRWSVFGGAVFMNSAMTESAV